MQPGTVLTFGLGEGLFALPVTLVQEILDTRPVSPLPDTPPHLLGVIDVRGTSVAVVDLRQLLSQPPLEDTPDTRFVVLLLEHGGRRLPVALRVDRVIEVSSLDGNRLEPVAGADLLRWNERLIEGLGRRHGAFVTVLRLQGLFDSDGSRTVALLSDRMESA
jgi:purine-binding chemotaxis protein CheW